MKLLEVVLNTATVVAAAGAVAVAAGVIKLPSQRGATPPTVEPRRLTNAGGLTEGHLRLGPKSARLTIVEFGDFECPACSQFAHTVDTLRQRFPDDVALVYRHFPMPYHRMARPLARASECAAAQGRFESFYYGAFLTPLDLGLDAAVSLARMSRVPDPKAFIACAKDTAVVRSIESDALLAKELAIPGTPAVVIDGVLYPGGRSLRDLEKMLAARQ